ncbi:MAG: ArsC/Spx/MgsR family protein [Paracoccaceae bacterium]
MAVEIWHNPRCSKSRQALAHLQARGTQPVVRLYLVDPPSAPEIESMLQALGLRAADLLRPREGASWRDSPPEVIIGAMAADPSLIERPVIRHADRAVIGRPTEAIDTLF